MADDPQRDQQGELQQRQQAHARLFSALYGLSATNSARDISETLTDVAALLSRHAPRDSERADWQCVMEALQGCLDRPAGGHYIL